MATVTRTFELSQEAAAELDRRAQQEQRPASDVVNDLLLDDGAITDDNFTPEQWEMIRPGEAEADAGQFVTNEKVQAMLSK